MSEEIKNQQAAEPEALTETEINEQMQVRINKMHQIEEKGWNLSAINLNGTTMLRILPTNLKN